MTMYDAPNVVGELRQPRKRPPKEKREVITDALDYLLDFACDEKILKLYKMVYRRYLYVYPSCIKFYIEAYREMWEDEDSYSVEHS